MAESYYVPMRLKGEESPEPIVNIHVSTGRLCGHEHTVCYICAAEWATDYDVYWSRTKWGRAVRDQYEAWKDSKLPVSVYPGRNPARK